MLEFYNTKTRSKEPFTPLSGTTVTMYSCGPTVYNFAHIGNLRAYVMADLIRRTLEWQGFSVKQVINITDVGHLVGDGDLGEDKMAVAAKREGRSAEEIATFYTERFFADLKVLDIEAYGTLFPKATEHVAEQIALIGRLEKNGSVYHGAEGVYFDTSTFPRYAEFAHLDLEHLKEGARVQRDLEKRHPADFLLWKFHQGEGSRLQEWDSPWGRGFPGWHIECSAMSMKYLGETLDIHTGGIDHIPVHHTNEIAQSEAATGKEFVRFWMHSAFMTVDGEKMSKSLGNTYTLADLGARGVAPLAFRYWLYSGHYRTTLNFTWDAVNGAQSALERIYEFLRDHDENSDGGSINEEYRARFEIAIDDDLNMPEALAILWMLMKDPRLSPADKRATLIKFDTVLGLGFADIRKEAIPSEVQTIATEREAARAAKDWVRSDSLREEAHKLGYELMDTPEGQKIRKH